LVLTTFHQNHHHIAEYHATSVTPPQSIHHKTKTVTTIFSKRSLPYQIFSLTHQVFILGTKQQKQNYNKKWKKNKPLNHLQVRQEQLQQMQIFLH
jgi:hypothetical protein